MLQQLDRAITAAVDSELADHSTSRLEWQMVALLSRHEDGLPWAQLERLMPPAWSETEFSQAWTAIEAAGWGEIDGDRWVLTDAGADAVATLGEGVQRVRDQVAQGVSDEEYRITLDVLERMRDNLTM